MQATGCVTSLRASGYGIVFIRSKPLIRSPPPSFLYGTYTDAWQCMHVPGCFVDLLAFGERLIVEHVGVAALFAEVSWQTHIRPTSSSAADPPRGVTARRSIADPPAVGVRGTASLPPYRVRT